MKPSQKNEICQKCGLWENCKTPFMNPSGSEDPEIIIVGEAPGEDEDAAGVPFVGRSGRLLRTVLNEVVAGKVEDKVLFTNVVRCRPEDNKINKREINLCNRFLKDELENYNPSFILLMGNSPLYGVLGETGISSWNGVRIDRDERTYIPLFHPAYILRNSGEMNNWLEAMLDAMEEPNDDAFEHVFPMTIHDLLEMYRYLSEYEYISFDCETSELDPFNESSFILSISFAAGEKAFSYPIDHPKSWWDDEPNDLEDYTDQVSDLDRVRNITARVLVEHDYNLIGHNVKFDLKWIMAQLDSELYKNLKLHAGGDTMLLSHLIDSRKGIHGLKRLAGLHLGMYEYEEELDDYCRQHPEANPKKGGSYAFVPLEILLPYGAKDSEATHKLHPLLYDKLSDKQKLLYDQMILQLSDVFTRMEMNGFNIDHFIADRYYRVYKTIRNDFYADLINNEDVMYYCELRQLEYDESLMKSILKIDKESEIPKDEIDYFTVKEDAVHYDNGKIRRRRKRKIFEFNPRASQQRAGLYYDIIKIPTDAIPLTDSGNNFTTKWDSISFLKKEYPIVADVRSITLLDDMISKYIGPAHFGDWESDDGRARSTYNLHGTRTGRPSSSDPNLMNIPTPEKEPETLLASLPIKNLFKHSFPDGYVMSVDYSGMELRVFASVADCTPMLDIHRSGLDFHSVVTFMARDRLAIKDITKDMITNLRKYEEHVRYRYKWTNWTLLYGGSAYTLYSMYDMTLEEAEETVETYYLAFPEVPEYIARSIRFVEENGYAESIFGRREYFPYINDDVNIGRRNKERRAAINMPIQSTASDTLAFSAVVIQDKLDDGGFDTLIVNDVYDSLVLDVPKDEIVEVADLCIDVMENITDYAVEYFPDIDFSWLKCPLKADVDVGTHYGSKLSEEEWRN